jgi:hypothetical protein
MRIHFPSLENRVYRVEYTDDLASGNWTLEATVLVGSDGPAYFDVPMAAEAVSTKRFYRIRVSLPE